MKRQPKLLSPPASQSGFTIIESLLAIIIVSLLMLAITPVIVLSVATRVQARRVELGSQAARAYIDGVRSGKIPPPAHKVTLGDVNVAGNGDKTFDPKRLQQFAKTSAPPPTAITNCTATNLNDVRYPFYCRNNLTLSLYCVDFDGDGSCTNKSSKDLIVQAFRSTQANPSAPAQPLDPTDDGSKGYLLGVRVYRADSFDGILTLQTTKDRQGQAMNKVATYTGGGGDRVGPLTEMTTEIRGTSTQYKVLCDRLGGCSR